MRYADRFAAGRELAALLDSMRLDSAHDTAPLVLGLPRGGVPVAAEIANELGGDLDIVLVRKLGVPWQPELAMGAIAEGGAIVINHDVVGSLHIPPADFERVRALELLELASRAKILRGDRDHASVMGRTVVVVDDGAATGATAAVACQLIRQDARSRSWWPCRWRRRRPCNDSRSSPTPSSAHMSRPTWPASAAHTTISINYVMPR